MVRLRLRLRLPVAQPMAVVVGRLPTFPSRAVADASCALGLLVLLAALAGNERTHCAVQPAETQIQK
jgi:hypothetical protein